mmetsp:Transcript_36567/g.53623  ORF Transcript_36567/g.53623 Transcript_36567/m.53623 type:complete len:230 (+) Transcript_36567:519-1208(+)
MCATANYILKWGFEPMHPQRGLAKSARLIVHVGLRIIHDLANYLTVFNHAVTLWAMSVLAELIAVTAFICCTVIIATRTLTHPLQVGTVFLEMQRGAGVVHQRMGERVVASISAYVRLLTRNTLVAEMSMRRPCLSLAMSTHVLCLFLSLLLRRLKARLQNGPNVLLLLYPLCSRHFCGLKSHLQNTKLQLTTLFSAALLLCVAQRLPLHTRKVLHDLVLQDFNATAKH